MIDHRSHPFMEFSSSIPAQHHAYLHDSSMYDFQDCKEVVKIELARARSYNVQLVDTFKYTFGLSYTVFAREFLHYSDHDPEDSSNDFLVFAEEKFINIERWKVEDLRSQQEELKHEIIALFNLTEDLAETLSENIVHYATKAYAARQAGHKIFRMDFDISLIHYHVLVPIIVEEEEATGVFLDYFAPRMVPATSDSIKSLKRKRVDEESDRNCVICLDDLSEGCESVSMPCSHSFHGDCIEEWLNTSHKCPICRFKMPTS